jgi:hypothetical protein
MNKKYYKERIIMKIRADRLRKGDIIIIGEVIKETVISVEIGRYFKNQTALFLKKTNGNIIERSFANDHELKIL